MPTGTSTDLRRRSLIAAAVGCSLLPYAGGAQSNPAVFVEVWKDSNCGCCTAWVTHLEAEGFQVEVHDTGNNPMRTKLGIDRKYASCHTALVGGYAIEGHVPAAEIRRLLLERPNALGLAAPGMPVGSPGMDGSVYEGRKDAYSVMLLARDGSAKVYQRYGGNKEGRTT